MEAIYHPEETRSFRDMGWIKLYQSFHPHYPPAPNRKNFGVLVVFDNGHIMPGGKGFGMHPHENIEIVSVVVHGAMVHSDTAGHNGVNVENAIQLISAGTGIQHSEYNYSETQEIDNLQIWFLPKVKNSAPRYQTMISQPQERAGKLQLLVSPTAENQSLEINQDVWMWRGTFKAGDSISYGKKLTSNGIYLYVISGKAKAEDQELNYRDGLGITDKPSTSVSFAEDTDILIIDVPMGMS
jgi:quercetin 2,3-dioxygenase